MMDWGQATGASATGASSGSTTSAGGSGGGASSGGNWASFPGESGGGGSGGGDWGGNYTEPWQPYVPIQGLSGSGVSSQDKTIDFWEAQALARSYGVSDADIAKHSFGTVSNSQNDVLAWIKSVLGSKTFATLKPSAKEASELSTSSKAIKKVVQSAAGVDESDISSRSSVTQKSSSSTAQTEAVRRSFEFTDKDFQDAAVLAAQNEYADSHTQNNDLGVHPNDESNGSNPNWQDKNESGKATVITQIDYAGLLGAGKVGQWVAGKIISSVLGGVTRSNANDKMKEIERAYASGEISDEDYDRVYSELKDSVYTSKWPTFSEYIKDLSDTVSALNREGQDAMAYFVSKAGLDIADQVYPGTLNDSRYQSMKMEEISAKERSDAKRSEGAKEGNVHVSSLGDIDIFGALKNVIPDTSGLFSRKDESTEDSGVSVPGKSTVPVDSSTSVDTGTSTALGKAALSSGPNLETVNTKISGTDYPQSNDEKKQVARQTLDEMYPGESGPGGDNELIERYFWPYVPAMTQGQVDMKSLANAARQYETVLYGSAPEIANATGNNVSGPWATSDNNTVSSINDDDRKKIIAELNKQWIKNGIPAASIAMFNAGMGSALNRDDGQNTIQKYVTDGGLRQDIESDRIFMSTQAAKTFFASPSGQMAVGLTLGVIGTVGAFMAAGPVGAVAAAGTLPFQTTEFANYFGADPFRAKNNLQMSGKLASDRSYQYDQNYQTAQNAVKDIGLLKSTSNPAQNLLNIQAAELALKSAQEELKRQYVYLEAVGNYDPEVKRMQYLEQALNNNKSLFDVDGNYIAKEDPPAALKLVNVPDHVTVTFASGKLKGGDGTVYIANVPTTSTVEIALPDGTVIKQDKITLSPFGGDQEFDVQAAIDRYQSYHPPSEETDIDRIRTIILPSGMSFSVGGKTYGPFATQKAFDVKLQEGVTTPVSFQQEDKQTKVVNFPSMGESWASYYPILEDAYKPYTESALPTAITFDVEEGSRLWVNGKEYANPENLLALPVTPGYYEVVIQSPSGGKWTKKVYVANEQVLNVSGYDIPETKKTASSGGGGGGGGSIPSSRQSSTTASMGYITYGDTCVNASRIEQDGATITPTIGVKYAISVGYHSIIIEKSGYDTWTKTVYISEGDTLTISPAFTASSGSSSSNSTSGSGNTTTDTTNTPTRRVFINSDPSSAKVLINGGSIGEWTPCYADLPYGYYTVTTQKSGYQDASSTVWVSATAIKWGSEADSLAAQAGVI